MVIPRITVPWDLYSYCTFEERGFEWVDVGLFKALRPRRVLTSFDADTFLADCDRMGFTPVFDDRGVPVGLSI